VATPVSRRHHQVFASRRERNDSNGTDSGAAYLVLGPVRRDIDLTTGADAKLIGEREFDYAGFSVSDAGDVDADGHDDLLVGAPFNGEGDPMRVPRTSCSVRSRDGSS
jgi:hypothetical protein